MSTATTNIKHTVVAEFTLLNEYGRGDPPGRPYKRSSKLDRYIIFVVARFIGLFIYAPYHAGGGCTFGAHGSTTTYLTK